MIKDELLDGRLSSVSQALSDRVPFRKAVGRRSWTPSAISEPPASAAQVAAPFILFPKVDRRPLLVHEVPRG